MSLSRAVDTGLDLLVAPGYSRGGIAVRRHLGTWPDDPPRLDGRTVLVTGGTSGIGRSAALGVARLGARVVITSRALGRAQHVAADLRAETGADVEGRAVDVSSLESLEAFTADWAEPLHVLVNNAGQMVPERTDSVDGVELTFATNVLGPWTLIDRLSAHVPSGGRIVNVTSGGMYAQKLVPDPARAAEPWSPARVYARSKRALVVITEMWAQRLLTSGIAVHAMHPGWVETPGVSSALPTFDKIAGPILRAPGEGADTIVWMAGAPEVGESTGRLWMDRQQRPTVLVPWTREDALDRERLWEQCERHRAPAPLAATLR